MSTVLKSFIIVLGFIAGTAQAVSVGKNCDMLLFKGETLNHKKAVRVCLNDGGGINRVHYQFGKIGQTPELVIDKKVRYASYSIMRSYGVYGAGIIVKNGEYEYYVDSGNNDTGEDIATIYVTKNGKALANIDLDPSTVVNNITSDIQKYGVRDDNAD